MTDQDNKPEQDDASENQFAAASPHSAHICQQAQILFDNTIPLHGLGDASRQTLTAAALLHDSPLSYARKKPYQAAQRWVQKHAPANLESGQMNVLAAILAYLHKKIKRKDFARLDLQPQEQRQALTIAALLRMAISLDDSRTQTTTILQVAPSRNGMWIVVDGPNVAVDCAAAQQQARFWVRIGYPEVHFMENSEAQARRLPLPEAGETIGIASDDPLSEAARKVMRFHFARVLAYEDGTRLGEDIEALHDMRVATRRLRAAFEVFGDGFERGALKAHLIGLRAAGRALGKVRDLDVFMEKAQAYLDSLPDEQRHSLDPLLDAWQEQRQQARDEMLAYLDSVDYENFKWKFNLFLQTPYAGALHFPPDQPVPQRVRELAPILIYTRLAAVRAYEPLLKDASVELLHALRIDFKKLRYTVEYFREVLGEQAEMVIEEIKTLQDHLGDLNDAEVAAKILNDFVIANDQQQASLPIEERRSLEGVVAYMAARHAERHRLISTFGEAWKRFNRRTLRRSLASAVANL